MKTSKKAIKNKKIQQEKIKKIKCWEFYKCTEKECPAYKSKNLKCWLFTGTLCRNEIQGKFIEKMEMCVDCKVFKKNMDSAAIRESCKVFNKQLKNFREIINKKENKREMELENISLELAIGLSEVFEALKKIAKGDPAVRISEASNLELISILKHLINITAENIGEIVEQSHEIVIGITELFDVMHRVSKGDLKSRVTGQSQVEILEAVKNVTNHMIEEIDRAIKQLKASEEAIRNLEEIEASILDAIPHAVIGLKERKIFFANKAVEKVFGWQPEELIGKKTKVLYRNDDEFEEIGKKFYPVLEKQRIFSSEFPCRRKDGKDILCMVSTSVIGKEMQEKGIVVLYEDITNQKIMQKKLEESEKKYIDLYQNAPDGYHSLGPDGTILEVNETWLKILGYDREEVVGKMNIKDLLTVEGKQIFQRTFPLLKEKGFIENIDYHYKKKDGTLIPVIINATAIYDDNGKFLKSRTAVRDNSEKKAFEQKLKYAAEEWRATFDAMPYSILLLDNDLSVIRTNINASSLFNMPFKDIIGKKCYELFPENNELGDFLKSIILENDIQTKTFEYYDQRSNKHLLVQSTPIKYSEITPHLYILSLIDISELKNKEKKLIQSRDAFLNMLKEIDFSYKELQQIYNGLIHAFVNAIDAKSPWTKGHSERVTKYALAIAREMGIHRKDIENLRIAALLHDIGKIGTYDIILDKPGRLTDEEFALIRMHPSKGAEILKPITQLKNLLPVIKYHHERLDGKGYPDGLHGDEIPLLSKIICVADSYDSMTSERPYRPAPSKEYAILELERCSGTQFDPEVVKAFLKILKK
ncbi:MAG: PAS domain S-box protein [Nitrospirae bacterium]|nr:PAS domain S-box protein [Nitrospirota bacterium]